jgi:cyclic beta-1,2-glucan synthetase
MTVAQRVLRRGLDLGRNGNGSSAASEEQPLRAELFSVNQLEQHAKSLAGWHEIAKGTGSDRLLPRLSENERVLDDAYELVTDAVRRGRRITPAAEWFLDNYHLIEEQIRTARRHFPRAYSRELPRLASGVWAGYPRVYEIALELISHTDGRVDEESLRAFISSYQTVSLLRLSELWAVPIMLRLSLLENLRRVASRVAAGRRERERAAYWAERMLETAGTEPGKVVLVLADMVRESPPLTTAFASEFSSRLTGAGQSMVFAITWMEQRLSEQGLTLEQIYQEASQRQAADQVSIGNSITSLRRIGAIEWRDFVEQLSAVEYQLKADPSGIYPEMDFQTRDHYRHGIEQLAKRSPIPEEEVARKAVDLARDFIAAGGAKIDRRAHVGYYIIGPGDTRLARAVKARQTFASLASSISKAAPLGLHGGAIATITAIVIGLVIWWAAAHGLHVAGLILTGIVVALCASEVAVALVHWAAMQVLRPSLLPRMDFSKGIPTYARTVVAVPTLLTDAQEVSELIEAMEIRYLANRDENLYFALLTDLRDAPRETMPDDEALIQQARQGIEELNFKYCRSQEAAADAGVDSSPAPSLADGRGEDDSPSGNGNGSKKPANTPSAQPDLDRDCFFLFHRSRRWNAQENCWMGWERKRGKLEDFNETLRGATAKFSVTVGPIEKLASVKYVITLDSDTQLPRDSSRELVGTMAHPLNRPRFDPALGRVTEGYSILQPRVGISMPSANRSRFARLFASEPGIDPYTLAVSDFYQDLFDEGSFIGKGIYDVDSFSESIGGRFPENQVLSHDLLEGAHARSGLVSDVLLFEEYPAAYNADVSRRHRWIRGDWQVVPWLLPRVPGPDARQVANPISDLSRWKILDNVRRSLVSVAMLALLVLGWFLPGGPLFYTALVLAIMLLPAILGSFAQLARRSADLPFLQHASYVGKVTARQAVQQLFALSCLPHDAYMNLDAIIRTCTRMFFTRKNLLEWRTARDAQRSSRNDLFGYYTSMWVLPTAALAVTLLVFTLHRKAAGVEAPVAVLWLACPAVAWWLSRPLQARQPRISDADIEFLRLVARRTWRYFERFVSPEENFLPPDNFQEDPPNGIAHRTSPTNIGLALLANLTALDFGYITAGELMQRITQTLGTLDRLPRYRGHLFNWYDTLSLQPLNPQYVSTVDSGNFAGHLISLAAGLSEIEQRKIFNADFFRGLLETLAVISETAQGVAGSTVPADLLGRLSRIRDIVRASPRTLSGSYLLLQRLIPAAAELRASVDQRLDVELVWWTRAFESHCRNLAQELSTLAPWVELAARTEMFFSPHESSRHLRSLLRVLDDEPLLADAARLDESLVPSIDRVIAECPPDNTAARDWFQQLRAAVIAGSERAAARLTELKELATRCREQADFDYEFLYDRQRHLLSIGFNVNEHRLDAGFYDLLASEARLGSFVAIAQGKLPQEHWFSLGRLLTTTGGRPALLSWSGSMFEYLMPLLVMPTYEGTLLDETYHAVVERQIEYARKRGVPWGISESGYSKTDANLNYQYRAFGVPGLGFKRGLAEDLVIAPYASVMALMVYPEEACRNLQRLRREGQLAGYGFYEAIDYTASRLPVGKTSLTVRSFMAHHQGMSFLSLSYLLHYRPMQRRFDFEPAFRATELLLQERIPKTASVFPHPAEVSESRGLGGEQEMNFRVFNTPFTPVPELHLLSNGRYHVMVTAAGGGYSRWRDIALTRWHEDAARDNWGTFIYLRDLETTDFWSVTYQPTLKRGDTYEAVYSQGRAEFRRRDGDIHTHVQIAVSPEDDVEVRRITLNNRGREKRDIELTSYAEVVLATPAADAAHPSFSNLFVQTQLIRPRQAILCTRRPRSADERPPWMLHLLTVQGTVSGATSFETGRAEFIGRMRNTADPAALHATNLTDSNGSVLDPIVSIRNAVTIEPDSSAVFYLVNGVSETREGAMLLIEKYHDLRLAERVFELAWTHSQVVLRQLDTTESEAVQFSRLASNILYASPRLRAAPSIIARNHRGQSGLWAYGISGDFPIVLVRIGSQAQVDLVSELVLAHAYWRVKGLTVDLVIWNEDQSGYRQVVQDAIQGVIVSRGEQHVLDRPGGIFVRRVDQMSEEDKILLQTVARVIISDTAGTLVEQLDRRVRVDLPVPRFRPTRPRKFEIPTGVELQRRDLAMFNGLGGFTRDGREYISTITGETPTPAPWCNVIANRYFGTVISESGGAYTWCENAQAYRLTPWFNDPITDVTGEAIYLRDEESGRFWSPMPSPARGPMPYTTRHGFGYTIFEYVEDGISTELTTYVALDAPIKFLAIKIRNDSARPRRLSLTGYFELVLGDRRSSNLMHIVTEVDPKSGALFARNAYNATFASRVTFLDVSETARTVTGDRTDFLGPNGSLARPTALFRTRLSGRVGAALDPCAAVQTAFDLADGQQREIVLTFGCGIDQNDARSLVSRFRGAGSARSALEAVWQFWNRTLGAVYVHTPDESVNFLANGWLLYQVISSRLWGRSGFYQSGGAYGFRDQLQDSMALVHNEPTLLREQILRSASRQFREGDVQHWWHPPEGRGVRTHISDDYLWLPFATCRYVSCVGDTGVLDEKIPFLEGRPVNPDEESYYDLPVRSEESASLYEHCVRAIRHGLRFGEYGLPLMGSGDWNDGMNLVGAHGKGESVWLAFFLHDVLRQFALLARRRQDADVADLCVAEADKLRANIEAHAWDGQWYRRAYFDDGQPLGSSINPECKIDSLSQSWSVLSGAGVPDRAAQAMEQVDAQLVDRDLALIKLLSPPFDSSALNPGYIKGYVPGVRENGGQYTHAAVWAVMAFAAEGNTAKAWELFNLINPVRHGDDAAIIKTYKVEPYVIAADVYTNPQHPGRGGWTWYTGSAAWMYRLITESLLGITLDVDRLRLRPIVPDNWNAFEIHYRYRETFFHIRVKTGGKTVRCVTLDGVDQPDRTIPLRDDRQQHNAEVELGPA